MSSGYETERPRNNHRTVLFFGLLFIALVLMITCVLNVPLLGFQMEPLKTPTQEILLMEIPTAIPASHFSISLPVILSPPGSVMAKSAAQSQIWEVIKIRSLGYEMDGQHYDLAVFRRVDSLDTVKAYCIDRGLDTPDLGIKYLLNTDGIFVPFQGPESHSFQRFSVIQY